MADNMKNNAIAALKKLGVGALHIDALTDTSAIDLKLYASGFSFSVPSPLNPGQKLSLLSPMSLNELHQLQNGTMSAETKDAHANSLAKTISLFMGVCSGSIGMKKKSALELLNKGAKHSVVMGLNPAQAPAGADDLAQQVDGMMSKGKAVTKPSSLAIGTTKWPAMMPNKHDEPVPLVNASTLYQAVHGTSGGSRYFMIAAQDNLRVAARYQGDSLSVRVEGAHLSSFSMSLKANGFSVHDSYASVHLKVSDDLLGSKTLGALLTGLQGMFETPLPDLLLIKNIGN